MFRAQQIEIPDGLDGLDLTHALLQRLAAKKAQGLLCVSIAPGSTIGGRVVCRVRGWFTFCAIRVMSARSSVDMGWAGTLYHASDHWVRSELEWDRSREMLRPQDWVELHFEALMDAPEAELARICDFLGVPLFQRDADLPGTFDLCRAQPKDRASMGAWLCATRYQRPRRQDCSD